ncbi:hypothetical protein [Xanthomonas sp. GPE 39]|uniref:hypothetical protein n=1 Tax=Xanthomonas sp. GPE 39 TaxID=1583099 RepID=UPI0005F2E0A5|nr:hypothetical protein [Xanthomonas sp. GPE 39]
MKGVKWAGAGVVFLAMAVAGLYLAGWRLRTLLSVHTSLVWNIWIEYLKVIHQSAYLPCAGKVELIGALGFGAPLLAWLSVLIALFKPKPELLHATVA